MMLPGRNRTGGWESEELAAGVEVSDVVTGVDVPGTDVVGAAEPVLAAAGWAVCEAGGRAGWLPVCGAGVASIGVLCVLEAV